MTAIDTARRYGEAWAALTPGSIDALLALTVPEVRFKDPFNDVRGRDGFRRVLENMFEDAPEVKAEVLDVASGDSEAAAYLRWRVTVPGKEGSKALILTGMTHLILAPDGAIAEHIDHWDAAEQLYERLPVLGTLLRFVKKRIAA